MAAILETRTEPAMSRAQVRRSIPIALSYAGKPAEIRPARRHRLQAG